MSRSGIAVDASQIFRLATKLAKMPSTQRRFASQAIMQSGLRGVALVKRNASGRPGPRVRTGDYRRSLNMRFAPDAEGGPTAFVGSAAPQAQRLEEGFVGADSLGRVYDQPPFPHFRPMAEQVTREWDTIMTEAIARSLSGT